MINKRPQDEILSGMDEAARQAKEDFDKLPEETKKTVAVWMRKWYLKAGYRRLGRIMVSYAKGLETKGKVDST